MAANGSELEDPERDGMPREGRATPLQNAFEHPFAQEKAAPPWITNALCVQNRRMLRAGSTESRETVSRSCEEWVRQMGPTAGQLTFASHPISFMTNNLGRCFTCISIRSCCSRLLVVSSRKQRVMSFVAKVTDM
ncbi:hypothetical protein CDAR_62681 [Caerostris darwini]|uniref:Uncharacterized protein n=1 Tax=Caerostris darwini TaxID=1538125 RepID=A0AAV4UF29_9ARAC|nr:hypothetical protein CDAR_62681 [Caerostris darwini]